MPEPGEPRAGAESHDTPSADGGGVIKARPQDAKEDIPIVTARLLALAAALAGSAAAAGCETMPPGAPAPGVAEARGGDDFALSEGRDRVAMMEDHFVAVAGGRILGGTMLLEDTARLVSSLDPAPLHAYLFRAGEQGDREESMPILYGKRVAGNGLLAALGVKATWDPGEKVLTLSRGDLSKAYAAQEGSAAASFLFRSASGAGPSRFLECVVASGYAGNALLDAENAALSGLGLSEIPGNVRLAEAYTGRVLECRRALARVEIPELGAGAIVEVIFPR